MQRVRKDLTSLRDNDMKRRLKRYKVRANASNQLKVSLNFKDGYQAGAVVDSISLQSLRLIIDADLSQYLDSVVHATIVPSEGTEVEVGRMFVLRQNQATELLGRTLILKTLESSIPLEKFMYYLEIDSSDSPYAFELPHGKFTLFNFYNYQGSDDVLEKADAFHTMQKSWRQKDVYQFERFRLPSRGTRVELDRLRPNGQRDYLVFGSNDYLGLANHPRVVECAREALLQYGFGATGSPLTTGQTFEHIALQEQVARIFRKESALLYNSGYSANLGALSALGRKGDLILYDSLCHASIMDGLKLASEMGAKCIPFKHNDMIDLEKLLKAHRSAAAGCLIVTEGIFSMDGDLANLRDIVPMAKQYYARTYLDVAHDFGVVGETGIGVAEHYHVLDQIDVIMGTFSKIAGGIGGFCTAAESVIQYLRYMSRAFMFSVSLPPAVVCGVREALRIFSEDKTLLENLKSNIRYFVQGLRRIGINIPQDHCSTICPVMIGDEDTLSSLTKFIFDKGIHVTPIVFPAVKKGEARFRFTVTAMHTQSDLDYALLVLEMALKSIAKKEIENQPIPLKFAG